MTPTELRALAETLEHECALRLIAGGKNHEEAQACEQAADYLRETGMDSMVADVEAMVKRHPGAALVVAGVLGFMVGRTLSR